MWVVMSYLFLTLHPDSLFDPSFLLVFVSTFLEQCLILWKRLSSKPLLCDYC